MPTTNRPFFANFFSALRARTHPALKATSQSHASTATASKTSPTTALSAALASSSHSARHLHTSSPPSQTPTTQGTAALVAAQAQAQMSAFRPSARALHAGFALPAARSPSPHANNSFAYSGSSPTQSTFVAVARSRTPSQTRDTGSSLQSSSAASVCPRRRRGSDGSTHSNSVGNGNGSSTALNSTANWKADGVNRGREPQTWYIGGRTAGGEESFYPLGIVKRYRSADRMSLDRLSM